MIPKSKVPSDIMAMLESAPEVTFEQAGVKPGKVVARGFAAHRELINKNGRPKSDDPRVSVSIRLPKSYVDKLRQTGRGWQTRIGDYIATGISAGAL